MKNQLITFMKKEAVLTAAMLLAAGSMLLVPPDGESPAYIDYKTLSLLFCLMTVMAGLQMLGVFYRIGEGLLGKVHREKQVAAILVLLCFFSSMLITNDVALITFVPFAITVLKLAGLESMMIPVIAMQTIAANLGSMTTPIGNPQNLYLYSKSGIGPVAFVRLMLPYAAVSLGLIAVWLLLSKESGMEHGGIKGGIGSLKLHKRKVAVYLALFLLCIGAVAQLLPWQAVLAAVAVCVAFMDRALFLRVDYSLLLTFTGFFVFIGNMKRVPAFYDFISRIVKGHETLTAVASSQIISNVPAALLLSGFTDKWESLIVGTNIGGLGTLIASMASLISYKYVAKEYPEKRGRYLLWFTGANAVFLAVLLLEAGMLQAL